MSQKYNLDLEVFDLRRNSHESPYETHEGVKRKLYLAKLIAEKGTRILEDFSKTGIIKYEVRK